MGLLQLEKGQKSDDTAVTDTRYLIYINTSGSATGCCLVAAVVVVDSTYTHKCPNYSTYKAGGQESSYYIIYTGAACFIFFLITFTFQPNSSEVLSSAIF